MATTSVRRARNPFGHYEVPRFTLGQTVNYSGQRCIVVAFRTWEPPIIHIGVRIEGCADEASGIEYVPSTDLKRLKYGGRTKQEVAALEGHSSVAGMSKDFCVTCQDTTLHRYRICIYCGDTHAVTALSYRARRRWGYAK